MASFRTLRFPRRVAGLGPALPIAVSCRPRAVADSLLANDPLPIFCGHSESSITGIVQSDRRAKMGGIRTRTDCERQNLEDCTVCYTEYVCHRYAKVSQISVRDHEMTTFIHDDIEYVMPTVCKATMHEWADDLIQNLESVTMDRCFSQ